VGSLRRVSLRVFISARLPCATKSPYTWSSIFQNISRYEATGLRRSSAAALGVRTAEVILQRARKGSNDPYAWDGNKRTSAFGHPPTCRSRDPGSLRGSGFSPFPCLPNLTRKRDHATFGLITTVTAIPPDARFLAKGEDSEGPDKRP
jgi:hypothetical protein